MFEGGFKSEFVDRRVRLNASAYAGQHKDIQLDFSAQYRQTDPVTGALLQTQRTTTETINAPSNGKPRGFEADLAFAVTIENPMGESSFVMNARLSLAEIPTGPGLTTISIWSRNLLNNEHVFVKFLSDRTGTGGFFNEPRTFGFEISFRQ